VSHSAESRTQYFGFEYSLTVEISATHDETLALSAAAGERLGFRPAGDGAKGPRFREPSLWSTWGVQVDLSLDEKGDHTVVTIGGSSIDNRKKAPLEHLTRCVDVFAAALQDLAAQGLPAGRSIAWPDSLDKASRFTAVVVVILVLVWSSPYSLILLVLGFAVALAPFVIRSVRRGRAGILRMREPLALVADLAVIVAFCVGYLALIHKL
jgi:hypothetical protein